MSKNGKSYIGALQDLHHDAIAQPQKHQPHLGQVANLTSLSCYACQVAPFLVFIWLINASRTLRLAK